MKLVPDGNQAWVILFCHSFRAGFILQEGNLFLSMLCSPLRYGLAIYSFLKCVKVPEGRYMKALGYSHRHASDFLNQMQNS